MTPKERLAKLDSDLRNLVDTSSSPGNFNSNPYMHGMANGLILARATLRDEEPAYMPAPAKWLDEKYNVAPDAEPVDHDALNGFDEEFLIGLWIADQRREGAKTIDLEKVETIREGIRYALELRTPPAPEPKSTVSEYSGSRL